MAYCSCNGDSYNDAISVYSCGCQACSSCPYPEWVQPIFCNQTRYTSAGDENGATLVIHTIVLEPCGDKTCTPRTFTLNITGPSYPNGETFTLRAGSCIELDEPLVISGLIPGCYTIEQLFNTPNEYVSTFTGPVCGQSVMLTNSASPTVVTIVNRKRLCRLCRSAFSCGCGGYSI